MDQIIISEKDQRKGIINDIIEKYLKVDIIDYSNYDGYFLNHVNNTDSNRRILCSYYKSKYIFIVQHNNTHHAFYLCEYLWYDDDVACDRFINSFDNNKYYIQEIYFITKYLLLTVEIINNGSYEIYINKISRQYIKSARTSLYLLTKIKKIHHFNNYPVITWIHSKKQNIINIDLNCMSAKYNITTNEFKINYYKPIKRIPKYLDIWIKCCK